MTTTASTATRICPECNKPFAVVKKQGKPRVFCSDAHKAAHANRRTARGKALVAIAMGWRQARGSGDLGKELFGQMTEMLDAFNAEDLADGRMGAKDYAASLIEFTKVNPEYYGKAYIATRYMDRKNG
jgi:hypothetical protein